LDTVNYQRFKKSTMFRLDLPPSSGGRGREYITNSMTQSPCQANRSPACQEIRRILWNSKVHYRIYKNPPHAPIVTQLNPVHAPPPSHVLKIHFDIILPSMPGYPTWCPSLRSPYQNPVCTSPLPHTCHMPRPSHSSRFYHPNYIWG
jgi:hypothetical protein